MSITRPSRIEQTTGHADFDLGSFWSDTVDFFKEDAAPIVGGVVGGAVGSVFGPAGTVIGAKLGSSLGGAYSSSQAASEASDAQAASAQQAADINWQMYQQSRADQTPWLTAGNIGLSRITGLSPAQLSGQAPIGLEAASATNQRTYGPMGPDEAIKSGSNWQMPSTEGYWQYPDGTRVSGTSERKPGPYGNNFYKNALSGAGNTGQNMLNLLGVKSSGFDKLANAYPGIDRGGEPTWIPGATDGTGQAGGLLAGPSMADFKQSPYYNLGMEEQLRAMDRYNNSRGLYASGKGEMDLMRAANLNVMGNYGNYVNDWIATKLNPAQSLAGLGQTAGTNLGQLGLNTGGFMGSAYMNAGNARASGYQARQEAMGPVQSTLSGVGQKAGEWLGGKIGGMFGTQQPSWDFNTWDTGGYL